jgi:hypothetical protein
VVPHATREADDQAGGSSPDELVPQSRRNKGHSPAFLVGRDKQGRLLGKRLLYEYTLAP